MRKPLLYLLIITMLSLQTLKAQDITFQRLVEWDAIEEALHQEAIKFIRDRQTDSSLQQRYIRHPETGLICEILGDEQLFIVAVYLSRHDWPDYTIPPAQQSSIKTSAERKFTNLYGKPKISGANLFWFPCSSWYMAADIVRPDEGGTLIILTIENTLNL